MKILWFAPYPTSALKPLPVRYPPSRFEHPAPWVVNLTNAIVRNYPDIELHVATINANVSRSFTMQKDGVFHHVCKSHYRLPFSRYFPLFKWDVFTRFRHQRTLLCDVSRKIDPDVIHAFGTEMAYAVAAKDSGKPYVIYMQGIIQELAKAFPNNQTFAIRVPLEKEAFEDCRYYATETEFAAVYVQKMVTSPVIFRMANSVTDVFFKVHKNPGIYNRLLFVGSLIPNKGIEELLVACNKNRWPVTIVGQNAGDYSRMLMEQYKHNSDIFWTGRISTEEITKLMSVHDALVLPSYMDTSPYVVAEAMAAGLPVVATRVGGIPDMVEDGITGVLVEPKNVDSLSVGIRKLYSDSEKLLTMGVTAKRVALERFSPKSNARILVEAYRQILRENEGRIE